MDKYNNLAFRNIGKIDFTRIENDYIKQNIDFKTYKKQKLEHLDQVISTKIKIYLDLKYIIKIRDSILEKNSSINKRIFFRLKELVNSGKVICPFSENILDEILKQSSLKTRNRTAQILDILSKNISLKSLQYILIYEFKNVLRFCNGLELEKVRYWDYPISVIGDINFNISVSLRSDTSFTEFSYTVILSQNSYHEKSIKSKTAEKDVFPYQGLGEKRV